MLVPLAVIQISTQAHFPTISGPGIDSNHQYHRLLSDVVNIQTCALKDHTKTSVWHVSGSSDLCTRISRVGWVPTNQVAHVVSRVKHANVAANFKNQLFVKRQQGVNGKRCVHRLPISRSHTIKLKMCLFESDMFALKCVPSTHVDTDALGHFRHVWN